MVVAVVAVGVMEMAVHQVVHMIPVRHRRVTAARPVDMALFVPGALVIGSAPVGMLGVHLDDVFIDVPLVGMMEMPIVEIIDVSGVFDGDVAAVGSVLVGVVRVNLAVAHGRLLRCPVGNASRDSAAG